MLIRSVVAGVLVVVASGITTPGCGGGGAIRRVEAPEGISFMVSPSDAEVLVDNVVRGKASDFTDDHPLKVQVGGHVLELRAPEHVSYIRRLDVSPHAKRIEATLLRKEGAFQPPDRNGSGGLK